MVGRDFRNASRRGRGYHPGMTDTRPKTQLALLSVDEMYRADALAIEGGIDGETLMEVAGKAIVDAVAERWDACPVSVLTGPGNNGGDGFVAARHLAAAGWPVMLYPMGGMDRLKGDAAIHAGRWRQETGAAPAALDDFAPDHGAIVIDCLFGAGLTRPVEGAAADALREADRSGAAIVACDLPSGINGDTGEIMGFAAKAELTVTFARAKTGHRLMPGRDLCGDVVVADIGIPDEVIEAVGPRVFDNDPALWTKTLPQPATDTNKFRRGHLQVVGGAEMTGAARLAARAARRAGAGLATILSPAAACDVYRAGDPGTLVEAVDDAAALTALLADARRNALVVGPGNGLDERTRSLALTALASGRPCVLDADALSVFRDDPTTLFDAIAGPVVLTPHEGEFARIFAVDGDKLSRTRAAAQTSGAVVLLKGADTVIAAPDAKGSPRAAINGTGIAGLATAGSGDVLAGLIGGLMAQGMAPFEAATAGAWLHGRMGETAGPGLIAEDLPEQLPAVLASL